LLRDVPVKKVKEFEAEFLSLMKAQHKTTLEQLKKGALTDEITNVLEKVAKDLSKKYAN
jgi:F-type H+-transporting ATPase subunit alpha